MAGATDYLAEKLIEDAFRAAVPLVGLFVGDVEVSAPSYERRPMSFSRRGRVAFNLTDVFFPLCEEKWGRVSHIALFDQAGNQLTEPQSVAEARTYNRGDQAVIRARAVEVEL